MEERQKQIREGAGLEESRLNREFIDWLQRWSTPILLVILVLAAGYIVYQRIQQARQETITLAFMELEAATSTSSPNPRALEDIARTYKSTRGIPHLARLAAADEYLRASRLGVAPGSQVAPDGAVADEDRLNDEQRSRYLGEAERLYRDVLQETQAEPAKAIHTLSASYGIAAIAESKAEFDRARAQYQSIIELAERTGYIQHAELARRRLDNLDNLAERPRLYAAAELPRLPGDPDPNDVPPSPALPSGEFEGIFQPPANLELQPEQEIPGILEIPGAPAGEAPSTPEQPAEPPAP